MPTGVRVIRNVAYLRHKESMTRIAALAAELRKLGAEVEELPDGLVINPPPPDRLRGASIATYDDHRMAMSFAVAGLRIPGLTILDPGCVAKTYPGFWDDLAAPALLLPPSAHPHRLDDASPWARALLKDVNPALATTSLGETCS